MSLQVRNQTSGALERVAGFNDTDSILSPSSKNPISNKAVYNALLQKIDKTVTDLINYYDKSQVYTKPEVRALIGAINTLTIEVVSTLPTQDISTTTIYFVGPKPGTNNYDEYVYVGGNWVQIGDTTIDLSNYVTSANLTTVLQDYYTKSQTDALFDDYYDKDATDDLLDTKQNTLDFDNAPIAGSQNPVTSAGIKTALDNILISGNGGSIIKIHHTAGEAAAGNTVTASKGSYSVSSTFDTSGDAIIIGFGEIGDITITATNGSETGSKIINIPSFSNYSTTVSYGLDYKSWLIEGGLDPSYYDSLDEVLTDEEAVRRLMTIHASVNYLASITNTDDEMVITVLNNNICAKWINLRDYALDTLYANEHTKAIMDEADKYGYGEWALVPQVPTMTSNTAPYGEVSASGVYSSSYYEYWAFNNSSSGWQSNVVSATTATWLQYKFVEPKIITTVYLDSQGSGPHTQYFNPYSVTIQGSNNGTTWENFATYTISIPEDGKGFRSFDNNTAYLYYRLVYNNPNFYQGGNYYNVAMNIQFYAWQPKGNIPVMTSDTAPYGSVNVSGAYSGFDGYKAFDNNESTTWATATTPNNNDYIRYNFTNPICPKKIYIRESAATLSGSFIISGSNDNGTTWTPIKTITHDSTLKYLEKLDCDTYYLSLKIQLNNITTVNNNSLNFYTVQFYGREMKVSIPKMTSNTLPYGEASASDTASTKQPYYAFDQTTNTVWYANTTGGSQSSPNSAWIQYKFPSLTKIVKMKAHVTTGSSTYPLIMTQCVLSGSIDGLNFTPLLTKAGDVSIQNPWVEEDISNDVGYIYYRLTLYTYGVTTAPNNPGCNDFQLYGFDYSERDWDTEHPRHYIYDHGLEFEPITYYTNGGTCESNIDSIYTFNTPSHKAIAYTNIDFTDYNLIRVVAGTTLTNSAIGLANAQPEIEGAGDWSYISYILYPTTTVILPYGISLDCSSINTTKYMGLGRASGSSCIGTATEWWLE